MKNLLYFFLFISTFIATSCSEDSNEPTQQPTAPSPYITKVFDYVPGVGQFTNELPKYEPGDTQESMNQKVLAAIGNNKRSLVSLGGFGGYVVVGFDHTIENKSGVRDFRVLGNTFYSAMNPDNNAPIGGNSEPGVICVAYDTNQNGQPDADEWYEIAGSAHRNPEKEPWYNQAKEAGNDVNLYRDYSITYYRPSEEPTSPEAWNTYIYWEDNQGNNGYKTKNNFHKQSYFPLWITTNKLTLTGTCLPQNGINEDKRNNYFVCYKFRYGYADNDKNIGDDAAIDIDWAVDKQGNPVHLPGIDFIRIHTGVNQENGDLGECSTEIAGIEDLHLLGISIAGTVN